MYSPPVPFAPLCSRARSSRRLRSPQINPCSIYTSNPILPVFSWLGYRKVSVFDILGGKRPHLFGFLGRNRGKMKKTVVKLSLKDAKDKQKAMKAVSTLTGIDSISADMGAGKLTVVGDADPVVIIEKLKKKWCAHIESVEEPNKEEKKEDKKEEKKDEKKPKDINEQVAELVDAYKKYNPRMTQFYVVHSMEENPNSCVIC